MGRDPILAAITKTPTSFNPRARMGRDQSGSVAVETALKFQSTRPHGARQHTSF